MDKKTILIVEDEDKLRMTVADFLKIYDYEILEAKDGECAIKFLKKTLRKLI